MSLISLPDMNNGDDATKDLFNLRFDTIINTINGNIDGTNIANNSITTSKIADGAVTLAKLDTVTAGNATGGWLPLSATPSTVVANGNRGYTCTFTGTDLTSTLSVGMRLKMTRNTAAPTKCTSLNGSTQFFNNTSPNKLTFTNNFVVSAWIKIPSYGNSVIASRYNGTSGWRFSLTTSGQVEIIGLNGGGSNFKQTVSYQSVPLNKWVHVAAQLDMTSATNSPTVNYVMIDGVDVPATQATSGTNPTALIQAGNLEIGSWNGGLLPFPGKIAQPAIYSAKVTQANILATISQGLVGTETSLASAYSFNNSLLDLNTTTPNNLTANGAAVATTADSPFAQGTAAGILEYGIITGISFSTNTTVTVHVPEGSALPTSGTISASAYSMVKIPYAFPSQRGKWQVITYSVTTETVSFVSNNTWTPSHFQLNVPIGSWNILYAANVQLHSTVSGNRNGVAGLSSPTYNPLPNGSYAKPLTTQIPFVVGSGDGLGPVNNSYCFDMPTSDIFTLNVSLISSTGTETFAVNTQSESSTIIAENAYL